MSGLTLPKLLAADPVPFDRAASAWEGLAEDLDNAAEQLIRHSHDLEDAWPSGLASETAFTKIATVRAEASNAYQPARRIFQALRQHTDSITSLRGQAQAMIDSARQAGFVVDINAGTVTATIPAFADHAQRYADDLGTILAQAGALDDSTTNTINANLPDVRTGFGNMSLPAVPIADLEGQRGRPPRDVNAWWNSLTPEQQEQAILARPDLVGWLDGVPASDRDTANRIALDRHHQDLAAREIQLNARLAYLLSQASTESERWAYGHQIQDLRLELADVHAKQATLGKVDAALAQIGGQGMLLGIDPAGDGKAIVSVGNPDTVRHAAVWVPGLGTELDDISGNMARVRNLQNAADRLTPEANDVAAIMWLGYDAPETDLSVVRSERSRQGAEALTPFVDGLRATHEPGAYHVTAVGHSYGSTVVAESALHGTGLAVDDLITAGSPGMHAAHAENLMDPRHVWAGSATDDPVSEPIDNYGRYGEAIPIVGPLLTKEYDDSHGISPHEAEFGANQYHVDTSGHSAYWSEHTESLENQARVVVGYYGDVGLEHGNPPPDWRG